MDWQPISSAPTDEAVFIRRYNTHDCGWQQTIAYLSPLDGLWIGACDERIVGFAPTHWSTLPTVPLIDLTDETNAPAASD